MMKIPTNTEITLSLYSESLTVRAKFNRLSTSSDLEGTYRLRYTVRAVWTVKMRYLGHSASFRYYIGTGNTDATTHLDFEDFAECIASDGALGRESYADFLQGGYCDNDASREVWVYCKATLDKLGTLFSSRLPTFNHVSENREWGYTIIGGPVVSDRVATQDLPDSDRVDW